MQLGTANANKLRRGLRVCDQGYRKGMATLLSWIEPSHRRKERIRALVTGIDVSEDDSTIPKSLESVIWTGNLYCNFMFGWEMIFAWGLVILTVGSVILA